MAFSDEKNYDMLKQIVEKNELCMLAYADENGEVVTYQGEMIGNIVDRAYFSKIITGEKEYVCQYLPTTGFGNDPRIIFSTAVYQGDKIKGVLFFSKEVEVLRDSLFQQSMFRGNENSLIVDSEGNILVKNKHAFISKLWIGQFDIRNFLMIVLYFAIGFGATIYLFRRKELDF